VLDSDAVLVASENGQALEALEEELDLRAAIVRVRFGAHAELSLLTPLGTDAWEWTLERAFSLCRSSRARVALVGVDRHWADVASEVEGRHDGVEVDRLSAAEAVRALVFQPERFDVVVCPQDFGGAADLAACFVPGRTTAWGRLAGSGPGVFGAMHGFADDIAGSGVADPCSMLLAAALMLGEGLGERDAATTLSAAVGRARANGSRVSTRGVADTVLAQLPLALANTEFYREIA
jgi:isocitrate/isopropylmalate dehydrogenase